MDDIMAWCDMELHQIAELARTHTTWQQTVSCVRYQWEIAD